MPRSSNSWNRGRKLLRPAQKKAYAPSTQRLKIQVLEERLRLQRIAKYGPGSEKLSNLQLELLEQEPGVSNEEVAAESEREAPAPVKNKRSASIPDVRLCPPIFPVWNG